MTQEEIKQQAEELIKKHIRSVRPKETEDNIELSKFVKGTGYRLAIKAAIVSCEFATIMNVSDIDLANTLKIKSYLEGLL